MKTYAESFLELLYPEKNTCFFCDIYDEAIKEKYICSDCEKTIKKISPPVCRKCSKAIDFNSITGLCRDCSFQDNCFEMSRSPFVYEGIIKKGIYLFKYHNKAYFYKFFGRCLVEYMKSINYTVFDFVVPVPLHRSKMRKRGYNQSELLARYISKKLFVPYAGVLKRTKKTPKQSEMTKEERRKNMKDAFAVKNSKQANIINNKIVLLVDDVYTTGSTVNECSKALLESGASKVFVITIAR